MDFANSKNINNRIKKTTIIIAVISHIILAIVTLGLSLLLLAIVGIVTLLLLNKDIDEANSRDNNFNKNCPFGYFGRTLGSFQYVFHHSYSMKKISIVPLKQKSKRRPLSPRLNPFQLLTQTLL